MSRELSFAVLILSQVFRLYGLDFSGTVVEEQSGAGVQNAEISIRAENARAEIASRTSDLGRFAVQVAEAPSYIVDVKKPNHLTTRLVLDGRALAHQLVIPIVRLGAIAGRITWADGSPVSIGTVIAVPTGSRDGRPGPWAGRRYAASLDRSGSYRLFGLPPGTYHIAARIQRSGGLAIATFLPNNESPEAIVVSGLDGNTHSHTTSAPDLIAPIEGVVESPVANGPFQVSLVAAAVPHIALATTVTDSSGRFQFENVGSDRYYLLAAGPVRGMAPVGALLGTDRMYGHLGVEVTAGNPQNVRLAVERGAAVILASRMVAGQSSKACIGDLRLAVTPTVNWGIELELAFSGTVGEEHTLSEVPMGGYTVTAVVPSPCASQSAQSIEISGGPSSNRVVVPVIAPGAIAGIGMGSPEGQTKPVLAVAFQTESTDGVLELFLASIDSMGAFRFPQLRPGPHAVGATPSGDLRALLVDLRVSARPINVVSGNEVNTGPVSARDR